MHNGEVEEREHNRESWEGLRVTRCSGVYIFKLGGSLAESEHGQEARLVENAS